MIKQTVKIVNPTGLHLQPASVLCKAAVEFESHITFTIDDTTANAKSVLSVLGACVKEGDEIELSIDGPDEETAMEKLTALIAGGLEE